MANLVNFIDHRIWGLREDKDKTIIICICKKEYTDLFEFFHHQEDAANRSLKE